MGRGGSGRGAYNNYGGGKGGGRGSQYRKRGYDYSGGQDRGRRDGGGRQEDRIPAVDQDRWFCKRGLMPYRSTRGTWFNRIGGARNDAEVLDTRQIAGRSTHLNCEAMNRPGKWISMVAGILFCFGFSFEHVPRSAWTGPLERFLK